MNEVQEVELNMKRRTFWNWVLAMCVSFHMLALPFLLACALYWSNLSAQMIIRYLIVWGVIAFCGAFFCIVRACARGLSNSYIVQDDV